MKCRACKGTGWTFTDDPEKRLPWIDCKCPSCHGTGRIPLLTRIMEKIRGITGTIPILRARVKGWLGKVTGRKEWRG